MSEILVVEMRGKKGFSKMYIVKDIKDVIVKLETLILELRDGTKN